MADLALDPIATLKSEELITELVKEYTIIIVTHNMQQAARVSHFTGFFLSGELIEFAPTTDLFKHRKRKRRKVTLGDVSVDIGQTGGVCGA